MGSHPVIDVGSSRRRTESRVGRGQDLWIIIVAAAIFSLIAMWSIPGFPAGGPAETPPRQRQSLPVWPAPMPRALDQARDSAMRPVPSVPPTSVSRPDSVWVPDRFVGIPGSGGQAHIPAHWERRLSDGESYVPPLTGSTPEGQVVPFPAGTRRLAP